MHEIKEFPTRAAMVTFLQGEISARLKADIASAGRAGWAVSGGSTPAPLFRAIRGQPLDWRRVTISLVDERWVPVEHPRSNEAFIRRDLLQDRAAAARFVGMWRAGSSLFEAQHSVNRDYAKAAPFSSILLGMGGDGHIASLFPDADGLEVAFDPGNPLICTALRARASTVTGAELERMSLTAAAIAMTDHVVLMITGAEKQAVFDRATAPSSALPIARLMRMRRQPLHVVWAP
ncbi:MAG: 6-phosphogluconolactonase [Sphingomonadales bacterium]